MRIIVILSAVLCFLSSLAVTVLLYPIRIRLSRHDGVFRADFFYLFFHIPLHNSARPVDPKDFTRRKFRKKLKKVYENSRQNGRHVLYDNRPTEDILHFFSRLLYYARLSVSLIDAFGKDKLPKLRIRVHEFVLFLHADEPADTAVLSATLQTLLCSAATLGATHFRITYPERDFYVAPAYFSASSLDFDVFLSLPALHYFRVFGILPPNDDRVLEVLRKHKRKSAQG